MKALVLVEKNQPLLVKNVEKPQNLIENTEPADPMVGAVSIVEIKAAALNHRDVWIQKGLYAGIKYPTILGSDGAGILSDGTEVIINPSLNWGDDPRAQGKNFRILGLPDDGTFAEFTAIPTENVVKKPAHLSFEAAAALPLAGLTAFRALFTKCQPQPQDRILISGIGGGVALFALQFAVAAGYDVWVTSGSEEKIERAKTLGAKGGFNYKTENWSKQALAETGGFDVIIDGAAGAGVSELVKSARSAARLCFYGGTTGLMTGVSPQMIFYKQLQLLGSTMGTSEEFSDMVQFVENHNITPVIDRVFDLENGNEAFAHMDSGAQFGKIILRVS